MSSPLLLTLTLILILTATITATTDEDIESLLALDDEEQSLEPSTSAELLSKAQRVVIELNHDTTNKVINGNEFVLVLGYAPWCERSAELMPRFAEAAMEMRGLGSTVVMAKIDAERYPKVGKEIGIKGFPTLLLFVNGSSISYNGGLTSEEIVLWVRKKTGEPVIRINSEAGAEEFLKKHSLFVVGLFDKFEGSEYEEFVKAAAADNEIQFVETSSFDVAKALFPDIKPNSRFIGLVKSEPERFTAFEGNFEKEKILQFVDFNKFPLVTTVTELNSVRVYSSPIKLQVYVFADADDFKSLIEPLQNIARKMKSEVMFLYVDIKEDNLAKPFLTIFGLEDTEDTVVAAFDNKIGSKYLLESDPTPSKIEEFCLGLLHGNLSPFYKSQPIPDNKEATILTVVGKTFTELVLSNTKNIFLEVHTPWCLTCETTAKNVEKLAKHFKGLDDLVFARIDAAANEHPDLQVQDYPTLLLYPAGDKSNPIKFSSKSSLKEMATLINKNLKSQQKHANKDEL